MSLLDIPPEVFENVIHELVTVAGIKHAWKLRGVCRTFKTAITYDVFAKQPVKAFIHSEKHLLCENKGLYLYYQSKVPLDAHPYLPNTVNDMVNYLAKELDKPTENEKETLRQSLCDTLPQALPIFGFLLLLRSGEYHLEHGVLSVPPPFGCLEKLVAALCLGHHYLITDLMQQLPSLASHPIFGAPLMLATKLGHEAAVRAMLKVLSTALNDKERTRFVRRGILLDRSASYYGKASLYKGFATATAVYTAINQINEELLNLLVGWYRDHGFTFFKGSYNRFLQTAIRKSSLAMVQAVLKLPYLSHRTVKKVNWAHFQTACIHGRADVVQLFLNDRYIHVNDDMSKTSPLAQAACSNSPAIVKILVDAGADVHQVSVWHSTDVLPIQVAIKLRNLETIRCLLELGSRLPHISDCPHRKEFWVLLRGTATS